MIDFTPRAYQHNIIDHQVDVARCGIWAGMGMGKTCATLTALTHLDLVEQTYPVLVIAPLRVARSTWPDEARKWSHLHAMRVSAIIGTVDERRAALRTKAEVYTINYENLPWLFEECGKKWPFKVVVSDESTKLKGFRLRQGSVRAKALAKVAHATPRFTELTGTPSPNGLQDLWGQLWFLDRGARLGTSYQSYIDRYFQTIQVGADRHAVQIKPLPYAQVQIEDKLRDICISLDARDYFDIDEPIVNTIRVELPAKARQQYKEMEKEMFLALECGSEVEALNAASKTVKCLQLANGAIYTDEKCINYTEIHDAKLQALESIIEEAAGMPVLVAYHFKSDLGRLQKCFPQGRPLDADPETIRAWNRGDIPVLFAHPASAGHGLNLQDGGNIIAFFGHWWNLEEYQQIIERIGPTRQIQAGHNRPVFIHHIVAADTVDEIVMARRDSKREVQDLLMEAMKR
jgi:SNF2 family DNA or RNA helicase